MVDNPGVVISGTTAGQIALSSVPNCTPPLSTDGRSHNYNVWAPTQDAYIAVTAPPVSTALTVTTGYLVKTGQQPTPVSVAPNFVIAAVSSSSGVLAYQQVN